MILRVITLCHIAALAGAYGCSGDRRQAPPAALSTVADHVRLDRHILIDQFGYLPDEAKVAVIRDPQVGYDKNDRFAPGDHYEVRRVDDGASVHAGAPAPWKG